MPTATVSVRVARAARLTLRVLDASGAGDPHPPGATARSPAGTAAWRWDGRTADGAWAPPGRYVAELTAVGPLGTTVLRRSVVADAFVATLATVDAAGREPPHA